VCVGVFLSALWEWVRLGKQCPELGYVIWGLSASAWYCYCFWLGSGLHACLKVSSVCVLCVCLGECIAAVSSD
jgi:hypothetical protein